MLFSNTDLRFIGIVMMENEYCSFYMESDYLDYFLIDFIIHFDLISAFVPKE